MSRTTQLVAKALREHPETRDDDTKLVLKVWELDMKKKISPMFAKWFERAPWPDSITRARRKFQMEGKYQASPEVNEERYKKFNEYKQTNIIDSLR